MAETLKVLAQSNPSALTLTDMYTVPTSTSTTVSTITICNQTSQKATVRVSVAVDGEADSDKQYIFYDIEVLGNDTLSATIGMTLSAADVVRIYSSSVSTSFNLFGVEVS